MSISSLPQLLAGMQPPTYFFKAAGNVSTAGRPQSTWQLPGCPAPGTSNTTLTGGTYISTGNAGAGQLNRNEAPGSASAYMAKFVAFTGGPSEVYLLDRLWDNGGITITSTSPQTINSPLWPARDSNGQSNGVGVYLAVECGTSTGAGTPTITISYTNSNGLAGQTATNQDPTTANSQVADFFRMKLAAGDVGVQSVQSITLSATWTSGTIHVVAYRIITVLNQVGFNSCIGIDAVTGGLPVIFPGTFLFMAYVLPQATSTNLSGLYVEAQG